MESLSLLKKNAMEALKKAKSIKAIESIELEYFGRKQGKLTQILRSLAGLSESKRKSIGKRANDLRAKIEKAVEKKRVSIIKTVQRDSLSREKIDITFPGTRRERGHLHPLTLIRLEAERCFKALGFSVIEGPEVESEHYNFDALNIPKDHPARDMQDTFWIDCEDKNEKYLLRTQMSAVQVRYMEKHNPPFRIIAPGKVFRNEATDAAHDVEFWQLEGLMVGKDVSAAHLKYTLGLLFQNMFCKDIHVRLRPSFFPFTEPSFEYDVTCIMCGGKGCSVCKRSGWLELGGAGMVNQKVFEAAGYVRGEWQGFAFGIGLDRIAMMKYKIPDIRMFRQNDVRFLAQF